MSSEAKTELGHHNLGHEPIFRGTLLGVKVTYRKHLSDGIPISVLETKVVPSADFWGSPSALLSAKCPFLWVERKLPVDL